MNGEGEGVRGSWLWLIFGVGVFWKGVQRLSMGDSRVGFFFSSSFVSCGTGIMGGLQHKKSSRGFDRGSSSSSSGGGGNNELPDDVLEAIVDIREYDVPYSTRVAIDLDLRCGAWYVSSFTFHFCFGFGFCFECFIKAVY